jgi:hydrogenase maturation protease
LFDVKTNSQYLSARPETKAEQVLVLGLGNILLKDEGVGVHVVRYLAEHNLPDNVEIIDGGTAGLDLLLTRHRPYKLILIDATRTGQKPATICKMRLRANEIDDWTHGLRQEQPARISLHQVGLVDALAAAQKLGCAPAELVIIGVEPEKIDYGLQLTEKISRRIPQIIQTVLEEIKDAVHAK